MNVEMMENALNIVHALLTKPQKLFKLLEKKFGYTTTHRDSFTIKIASVRTYAVFINPAIRWQAGRHPMAKVIDWKTPLEGDFSGGYKYLDQEKGNILVQ